jgi:hypothetical protein
MNPIERVKDPFQFAKLLWPDVLFYSKQKEIIQSVLENDETFVPAGHQLGKDFVSGFIVLWYFLTHHPVRIVTTSADHSQLESVLWGEIRRFIQTAKYPLERDKGGPIVNNHLHLRKVVNGEICGISYVIGRVAAKGEGMAGHHAPYTLFIGDEASGIDNLTYERADTWAKRKLIIGNPYHGGANGCTFFYENVKAGDLEIKE